MFLQTPKPKQWHRGGGCPEHVDCLDVVRCRCNGLTHAGPLPVFGPADELMPFVSLEAHYFWVKRQNWWPLDDVDKMVYDGAHLYPRVSVLYMLERRIIKLEDVTHQLTASRHFSEFPAPSPPCSPHGEATRRTPS